MKRAEHQPVTTALTIFAGIYAKAYTVADTGTLLPQHSHEWGHVTAITAGAVRVWQGGELVGDFEAPAMLQIPSHTFHQFLTLTPAVGLICIHNADHIEHDEPAVSQEARLELED